MSNIEDFMIEDGVLKKYTGPGGDVVIPNGVKTIGLYAFSGCTSLTSIAIPESVTEIGWNAFVNCSRLTSIIIPEGVTEIGAYAFKNCSSLVQIYFPGALKKVNMSAFTGCSSLKAITVSSDNEMFSSQDGILFNKDKSAILCCPACSLREYKIPEGVTEIGAQAFEDCIHLKRITFPASLKKIGDSAFEGCTELLLDEFPSGITHIGFDAFRDCRNLKNLCIGEGPEQIRVRTFSGCSLLASVTLPSSVQEIAGEAFANCTNLKEVTLLSPKAKCSETAFKDNSNVIFKMPYGFPNTDIRERSLLHFCNAYIAGNEIEEKQLSAFTTYMKRQRNRLIDFALANENILHFMMSRKVLSLENMEALLTKTNFPVLRGELLAYQKQNFTQKDFEKKENQEIRETFSVVPTVSAAKKEWSFENIGENEIRITGYRGQESDVVVPPVIGKRNVTEIGDYAFSPDAPRITESIRKLRKTITSISIPDSVLHIGNGAFQNCKSVRSVQLSKALITIGESAFTYCHALELVFTDKPDYEGRISRLSETVRELGASAFAYCSSLKGFALPAELQIIPEALFSGCKALKVVILPLHLKEIGDDAFHSCHEITSMSLPDTLRKIGDYAFFNCRSVQNLTVPPKVKIKSTSFRCCSQLVYDHKWIIVNGMLIQTVRDLQDCEIPSEVTTIGERAFDISEIKSVKIPSSVITIEKKAFDSCLHLCEIHMTAATTKIKAKAFDGCYKLKIYAPENSAADVYAHKYGIPFVAE